MKSILILSLGCLAIATGVATSYGFFVKTELSYDAMQIVATMLVCTGLLLLALSMGSGDE